MTEPDPDVALRDEDVALRLDVERILILAGFTDTAIAKLFAALEEYGYEIREVD